MPKPAGLEYDPTSVMSAIEACAAYCKGSPEKQLYLYAFSELEARWHVSYDPPTVSMGTVYALQVDQRGVTRYQPQEEEAPQARWATTRHREAGRR